MPVGLGAHAICPAPALILYRKFFALNGEAGPVGPGADLSHPQHQGGYGIILSVGPVLNVF